MIRSAARILPPVPLENEALTVDERAKVRACRLLCLFVAILLPTVGFLPGASGLEVIDPMWGHLGISGVLAGLLGASYVSERVRRCYVTLSWGLLSLTMAWVTVLAAANEFAGEYAVAVLFTYALFGGVVALGSESLPPTLWFLSVGGLLVGGALLWAPALQTHPLVLGITMALVALFESISARWVLSVRERLRGEQQDLRKQRDLLDCLVETSPNAIVRVDRDGTFVQATNQIEEVLGIDKEEILDRPYGDPAWEMAPSEGEDIPAEDGPFLRVIRSGEPIQNQEYTVERPDGTQRLLSISGTPLHGEDGEPQEAVFHLRDITDRERREKALRQAKKEAEEAAHLKSALLANISHEFRTPLTAIIGFADTVGTEISETELPEGSPLPGYLNLIEKSGKRLLEALENVLDLSRLEAGQMELCAEPVDLGEQARQAAEEVQEKAQEKEIDLQLEVEGAKAWADEGGIQIVFQNLMSNAIKYTGNGQTVWVRTYPESDRAVLEVEDTGVGMEPEMVERLFQPFQQASVGASREYEGIGVGLTVTKKAIEEMNGSIEVEAEEEGSRFIVRLPVAENGATKHEENTRNRPVAEPRP